MAERTIDPDFAAQLKREQEELRKKAEQDDRQIEETAGIVFSTQKSRNVFNQIDAATGGKESAIRHKKKTILEIRQRNLIDPLLLKDNPTVYIGSGIDWEYPVCLGARSIILVDPYLEDPATLEEINKRIKSATELVPEIHESEMNFDIDFGNGNEVIKIKLAPSLYGPPELFDKINKSSTDDKKHTRFQPPDKIGMLLGFKLTGTNIDLNDDPETMSKVVNGGYVLSDVLRSPLMQMSEEEQDRYITSSPEEQLRIKQQQWKDKGFDLIPLTNLDDVLLRKVD